MVEEWKEISLRFPSVCSLCKKKLTKNSKALYDSVNKSVKCLSHDAIKSSGVAGLSAKEKALKIENKRKEEIESIKYIGKIIYPLLSPSKEASKWMKGAKGEMKIGKVLEEIAQEHNFKVLHDRMIPGSKANIDHLLITNKGVFIIDAKNYKGKVEIRNNGTFFKAGSDELFVDGRNRNKIVEGVKWQVSRVKEELTRVSLDYNVIGVLGFVDATWPFFSRPLNIEGVYLNSKGFTHILNDYQPTAECDVEKAFFVIGSIFKEK